VRPIRPLAIALLALAGAAGAARAEPPAPKGTLHGILRGTVLTMEPYFVFKATEARAGVLGRAEGTTREFENVSIEVGADRNVLLAPARAAYEANRVRRELEVGEPQTAEVKADLSVVRVKSKDFVYACATRQLGRTAIFARGVVLLKYEAALVRLVQGLVSKATTDADEVDGWLPPEVRVDWSRETVGDFLVLHDGTVPEEGRKVVTDAVAAAHALVKRAVGGYATPFPPVVRITSNRAMLGHLSLRRDLTDVEAANVGYAAELVVAPKKPAVPDPVAIAGPAAEHALQYVLGSGYGEPLRTGFFRLATSAAAHPGETPIPLADPDAALARLRERTATSWKGILMTPTVAGWARDRSAETLLDCELAAGYLAQSGGAQAKASIAGWLAGFRKSGHPDGAAEAAVAASDPGKLDGEYWKYWQERADPPRPKKPGEKPPPEQPPGKGKGPK
jgi:hypothetical protein